MASKLLLYILAARDGASSSVRTDSSYFSALGQNAHLYMAIFREQKHH